jgi:hypothetical protein
MEATAPVSAWLIALLLGGLLGTVGQSVRLIVGLKKAQDEASAQGKRLSEVFDPMLLGTGLLIGFTAGVFALLALGIDPTEFVKDRNVLIGIVGAGYTGTDFIEGLVGKYLPGSVKGGGTPPPGNAGMPGEPTAYG